MPPAILTFATDIPARDVAAFNRWYDGEHMLERMQVKGFRWAARYVASRGSPRYLALYETDSERVLRSKAYLDLLQSPSPMTRRIMQRVRNGRRVVYRVAARAGYGHGAAAMTVTFAGEDGGSSFADGVVPTLLKQPGVVRVQLWEVDPKLSDVDTEERRIRGDAPTATGWCLFVEATNEKDLRLATVRHASGAALRRAGAKEIRRRMFRLLQLMTQQSVRD